ncbi:MAG: hypothetical protein K0A93_04595 [Desulfuromonadaceae bacterium]|nr:hypothetical protein [Desulfuromonadaceae bacterium]
MKYRLLWSVLLSALFVCPVIAAEPSRTEFDAVVAERCVKCHPRERIDAAISRGDNWAEIEKKMLRFGAVINPRDSEVMGVFWKKPVQPRGK